jgi:hypothetical protein
LKQYKNGSKGKNPGQEKKIPGQSMWDLWWTKWHWDRFFPEYFGFLLSVSFLWCSITRKIEKAKHFLSQGYTISLNAAVRP